jgi:hypothetical protein
VFDTQREAITNGDLTHVTDSPTTLVERDRVAATEHFEWAHRIEPHSRRLKPFRAQDHGVPCRIREARTEQNHPSTMRRHNRSWIARDDALPQAYGTTLLLFDKFLDRIFEAFAPVGECVLLGRKDEPTIGQARDKLLIRGRSERHIRLDGIREPTRDLP